MKGEAPGAHAYPWASVVPSAWGPAKARDGAVPREWPVEECLRTTFVWM